MVSVLPACLNITMVMSKEGMMMEMSIGRIDAQKVAYIAS